MNCPRCKEKMRWDNDFDCEDIHDCDCGNGVVSYYKCKSCEVRIELTTDCKGYRGYKSEEE